MFLKDSSMLVEIYLHLLSESKIYCKFSSYLNQFLCLYRYLKILTTVESFLFRRVALTKHKYSETGGKGNFPGRGSGRLCPLTKKSL